MLLSLPLNGVDFLPYSRLSNSPLSKALEARKNGSPDSVNNWRTIDAVVLSHSPFGFSVQVLDHVSFFFFLKKKKRSWSQKWPMTKRESVSTPRDSNGAENTFCVILLHSMSSDVDIKMIRPSNSSGSHCMPFEIFWISSRILYAVDLGKILNTNSVFLQSIPFKSSRKLFLPYHSIFFLQASFAVLGLFTSPWQSIDSEMT